MSDPLRQDVPVPESLAGVGWRPLSLEDTAPLAELLNASYAFDKQPFKTTLEEVRHSMSDTGLDLARDSIGGWTDDGRLVCFGAARPRSVAVRRRIVYQDGEVHPDFRRHGLGSAILAWTEARGRQQLAERSPPDAATADAATSPAVPAYLETYSTERLVDRTALYERHGFRPIRYYVDMRRPLNEPLPEIALPDGLALIGWTPDNDEEYRVAHVTAFDDHWGSEPLTPDEWQTRFTGSPMFRPDLTVGVLDGQRLVGYVIGYHAPEDAAVTGRLEGWLGQIGTLRDWRGRGVASALIVHAMRLMREAGFDDAMLDVDTDNASGALGLYERFGFRPELRSVRWEKPA